MHAYAYRWRFLAGRKPAKPGTQWYCRYPGHSWPSQMALGLKNPPANAGDVRDVGLTPGLGRSPGEGLGNLLQYSCLENPWREEPGGQQSIGVAKSWTVLSKYWLFLLANAALAKLFQCIWDSGTWKVEIWAVPFTRTIKMIILGLSLSVASTATVPLETLFQQQYRNVHMEVNAYLPLTILMDRQKGLINSIRIVQYVLHLLNCHACTIWVSLWRS